MHKKALKNSKRRIKDDRAAWAERCEALYNKNMKAVKKETYLPPGWIPFILGGLPRGPKKSLSVMVTTEDEVKDKTLFQSRVQRRAERMAGAQIGRSSVSIAETKKEPDRDREHFQHVHTHVLKINSSNPDEVRLKQYQTTLKHQRDLIETFERMGKDITMKIQYDKLRDENFDLMLELDRFNRSLIEKNNSYQNNYGNEELTVSTMDVGDLLENVSDNGDVNVPECTRKVSSITRLTFF